MDSDSEAAIAGSSLKLMTFAGLPVTEDIYSTVYCNVFKQQTGFGLGGFVDKCCTSCCNGSNIVSDSSMQEAAPELMALCTAVVLLYMWHTSGPFRQVVCERAWESPPTLD